jgi:Ser/Thr protein kinase RdoA (MazF antagonist)
LSTLTKAHGLDGSLVEPDWPPLGGDEIRAVLSRYAELKAPFEIVSVSPRPLSAASVVQTRGQRVFVKRHAKAVRDAEGLGEEHAFMRHLRAHGAPVPAVFTTDSGETAIEIGDWTYEVHATPHGADAYEDAISWTPFRSAAHARSAGEMMARLHLAAEGYDAPPRPPRLLVAGFRIFAADDPGEALNRYVRTRPALQSYLQQSGCASEAMDLLAGFHAELLTLLSKLTPLWTHNDLHASNLFWSDCGPHAHATAVIDFGLCDRTIAVHDLAHAIERNIVEWLVLVNDPEHPECVPIHIDDLWALLEGYESVRPLSAAERAALAPMLGLCHAEFALSEADYFLSVLNSREKAYMACEGYLVSHARWWHGAGARLLDALRNWAGGGIMARKVRP